MNSPLVSFASYDTCQTKLESPVFYPQRIPHYESPMGRVDFRVQAAKHLTPLDDIGPRPLDCQVCRKIQPLFCAARSLRPLLSRIRADRTRASVQVAELLDIIEQRLLDPDLQIVSMRPREKIGKNRARNKNYWFWQTCVRARYRSYWLRQTCVRARNKNYCLGRTCVRARNKSYCLGRTCVRAKNEPDRSEGVGTKCQGVDLLVNCVLIHSAISAIASFLVRDSVPATHPKGGN